MRTVDRNGIHLEQCDGCRGIFLDRGELEQIVGAEQQYYAAAPPPPYPSGPGRGPDPRYAGQHYPDSPRPYGRGGYPDSPRAYGGHRDSPGAYGHGKRKRRSFLEDLFD
jgi:Zn-finger nucleic acid-binding protein